MIPKTKQKSIILQEELERRILHGLACEWQAAARALTDALRWRMRQPRFYLSDTHRQLGAWSKEKRQISLSRSFVLNHAWDDIREVLLHEMAHQLADEALAGRDVIPHGEHFQTACRILGANPNASGNYLPLSARIHDEVAENNEGRLMRRIKKLMALAESQNRNEAESAMTKARELMEVHQIQIIKNENDRCFSSVFLGKPALRHFREEYCLANILEDFYFVQGIWVSAYVLEKGRMGNVLEISGTTSNLQIASHVHAFVGRFIEREWERYNQTLRLNRYRQTDFAAGIIMGFRSKLEEQNQKRPCQPNNKAIAPLSDPLLEQFMRAKYPRIHRFKRRSDQTDGRVLADGEKIGKTMVISKGLDIKIRTAPLSIA